mgnify:CR=1 FL=1
MTKQELLDKANDLPLAPGVYLMMDKTGEVIYVGKAKKLKNRVSQYFQENSSHNAKTRRMVSQVDRFDTIFVSTEFEALILENSLIKQHMPRYNILLKDDKGYPFVRLGTEHYPRFTMVGKPADDNALYFGPFGGRSETRAAIDAICAAFRLPTCSRKFPRDIGKERPCLYYHIGQCNAPCQGSFTKEQYRESVAQAVDFLAGNHAPVVRMLEEKMNQASEEMEFEKAIEYRDLIRSIHQVSERQKITNEDGEDKDVIALAVDDADDTVANADAVVQVFFIRGGKMIGREHFFLRVALQDSKSVILNSFVKQYYAGTPFVPKELMLETDIEDHELVEAWLSEKRGQKVYLRIPKKGTKEKLVEMARENAAIVLRQDRERIKREEGRTIGAVHEIEDLIGVDRAMRMEAYDISNISGFESVGSMIVYEKGKPKRSDYRKFKIKSVQGVDDYASMEEVLTRRFSHGLQERRELDEKGMGYEMGSFSRFPDLIMMDGGRGQVNVALRVLDKLGISIPVCGMVKDDFHRTRGLYYNNVEVPNDIRSEGFRLITRIQDEAHRFAIEYHRSLRSKGQVHSILDDIEGIGPTRRKALMRTFKSLEAIRDASFEELANAESMNARSAQQVYDFFHTEGGKGKAPEVTEEQ